MKFLHCFSQNQLSLVNAECEMKAKQINQHKLAVSQKEGEIKILSQQLQEQEALIAKLDQKLAAAREGSAKEELELEQGILKATDEAADLKNKLEDAEEGRQEAVREVEAAQMESKLLQSWMTQLSKVSSFCKDLQLFISVLVLLSV